jgi:methylenetetrahydrofolate reductase (NADPH)
MSAVRVSFEFFPPRQAEGDNSFWTTVKKLEGIDPLFVSVTYGAGGTTQERTLATLKRLTGETRLKAAGHLTCVGKSKAEVNEVIGAYAAMGIQHIVALRGDPPGGLGQRFQPHPQGYKNAADLVRGIKALGGFEVSVSAYPEKHPDSVSIEEDLAFMADKADNGASRALSQFFFHNSFFLRLRDRVAARGIKINLVPGILPITNFAKVGEFAAKCGAHVPPDLARRFHGLDSEPETRNLVAAMIAAEQVHELTREGVSDFHFYTLNRSELVYAICRVLGLGTPAAEAAA